MSYTRVLPRDLFNESNFLKCLGRLSLLIHDELAPAGLEIGMFDPAKGFVITMDRSSGDLYCGNVFVKAPGGRTVCFSRSLNSRDPWPIFIASGAEDGDDVIVFNDDGEFTAEFLEWALPPKNEKKPGGKS